MKTEAKKTEPYYIFILWNKALFCKDRILCDLRKTFKLEKAFFMQWSKEWYLDNLQAFYGVKSPDVAQKRAYIGDGPFYVVIVRDNDPVYDKRETYDGSETVNARIYDKKWLYRKWTGGNFRVHCSQDEKETVHDLTVLLGKDYLKKIETVPWDSVLKEDTSGIGSFPSIKDLSETLKGFDECIVLENGDELLVFSRCRSNVVFFLHPEKTDDRHAVLDIGNKRYDLILYGEAEGDVPEGFCDKVVCDPALIRGFLRIRDDYDAYLGNRSSMPKKVSAFLEQQGFSGNLIQKDPLRTENKAGYIRKIKDILKYDYLLIKEKILYGNKKKI